MFSLINSPDGTARPQSGAERVHLKEYRKRAGLTLQQVAARLELHATSVQKWETGVSSPTARDLMRLAHVYDVHPGALFLDPEGIERTKTIDALITVAALAGVNPAALVIAGTEPERRHRAEQLTRCNTVLDRKSPEWCHHWITLGELSSEAPSHRLAG
jgi:transcriptional regulator with XRE-family HTH domain